VSEIEEVIARNLSDKELLKEIYSRIDSPFIRELENRIGTKISYLDLKEFIKWL